MRKHWRYAIGSGTGAIIGAGAGIFISVALDESGSTIVPAALAGALLVGGAGAATVALSPELSPSPELTALLAKAEEAALPHRNKK